MANVLTVDKVIVGGKEKRVRYKLTLSGNYVQAVRGVNTGEVIDLTKAVGINQPDQFWGQKGPDRVYMLQGGGGYTTEILPGADGLHWLLKLYAIGANTEFIAGPYAGATTGDLDIYLEATGRAFD